MKKINKERKRILWSLLVYGIFLLISVYSILAFWFAPAAKLFFDSLWHRQWWSVFEGLVALIILSGIEVFSVNLLMLPIYILFTKEMYYAGRPFLGQAISSKINSLTYGMLGKESSGVNEEGGGVRLLEIVSTLAYGILFIYSAAQIFYVNFIFGSVLHMFVALVILLVAVFGVVLELSVLIFGFALYYYRNGKKSQAERILRALGRVFPDVYE